VFTPSSVDRVEPSGAVLAMWHAQEAWGKFEEAGDVEDVDANLCVQTPLFSSTEAAQGWLADHPDGRVLAIEDAWYLFRPWRDHMSAVLNLDA